MALNPYTSVPRPKISRNSFDEYKANILSMDFGKIFPVATFEVLPGDTWSMDTAVVGRLTSALKSPMLSGFDIRSAAFFCPYRLLMGSDANFDVPVGEVNYEDVLKGGDDGTQDLTIPCLTSKGNSGSFSFTDSGIMDSLGQQIRFDSDHYVDFPPEFINVFLHRAYRWIWNEFFRVEQIEDEIQVAQFVGSNDSDDDSFIAMSEYDQLLPVSYKSDYFTSALPYQQFGEAPAFPLEGKLPLEFNPLNSVLNGSRSSDIPKNAFFGKSLDYGVDDKALMFFDIAGGSGIPCTSGIVYEKGSGLTSSDDFLTGYVDLQNAVTFNVSDVRTAFQIQLWMERTARGGLRYTELLLSHFGVTPGDYRLQRPLFLGQFSIPWYKSDVVQTSASSGSGSSVSPQGGQTGQAICLGRSNFGKFTFKEYGLVLVLSWILPKPIYQQGIERQFYRKGRFDQYSPEFAHLSERSIDLCELYLPKTVDNTLDVSNLFKEFGFTGIWNEFRTQQSRIGNHARTDAPDYTFDYWHQGRYFASEPMLNSDFMNVGSVDGSDSELARPFAVQNEHPFIMHFEFNWKAKRPLPRYGTPGLVDHF
ncbi:MAG TPA: hypothetical protein IAB12_01340 [Candidatus Ornithospirochaeta avicola]|uniref:Major capsid protein n=1 Tax=Candidatus Ornithospirochaeta avicola TaxID=2840896 RepID=A0A9D1PTE7_9SPIO|nr:hypothetical protein [Candidatus Ornithospirochaeta avicola]